MDERRFRVHRRDPGQRVGGPGWPGPGQSRSVQPTPGSGGRSPNGSTRPRPGRCCAPASRSPTSSASAACHYVMLRSPDGPDRLLPAADPGRAGARPADGRHAGPWPGWSPSSPGSPGRLAPDQVRRVVADLAGNRMLEELPVDAFRPLDSACTAGRGRSGSAAALLAFARGRRLVVAADSTRSSPSSTGPAAGCSSPGMAAVLARYGRAGRAGRVRLAPGGPGHAAGLPHPRTRTSVGAAVLLGLNVLALACHELGHALADQARRPAGTGGRFPGLLRHPVGVRGHHRRVDGRAARPAAHHGVRSGHRTGTGRGCQALVGLLDPALAPWCFKLSFAWYVNVAVQPQPVPRAGRLLPVDGLARGAQPAGPRPGLGDRPAAPPPAGVRARWTARAGSSRSTGCSSVGLAGDRGQHRVPRLRRPGRRPRHRAVARRLGGRGCCWSWSSRPWLSPVVYVLVGWLARAVAPAAGAAERTPDRTRPAPPGRRAARLGLGDLTPPTR